MVVFKWMFPKNRGKKPKMDGENNGKPFFFFKDDLGVPLFLETPKYVLFSPRKLGKIVILTSIFFRWVVQPPTKKFQGQNCCEF